MGEWENDQGYQGLREAGLYQYRGGQGVMRMERISGIILPDILAL